MTSRSTSYSIASSFYRRDQSNYPDPVISSILNSDRRMMRVTSMIPIEQFEIEVVRRLTEGVLASGVLDAAFHDGELFEYDYNGYGYYLSFRHPQIPSERILCHTPTLVAEACGIEAGFIVLIEAHELTLECFPVSGAPPIPQGFRSQKVDIRVA